MKCGEDEATSKTNANNPIRQLGSNKRPNNNEGGGDSNAGKKKCKRKRTIGEDNRGGGAQNAREKSTKRERIPWMCKHPSGKCPRRAQPKCNSLCRTHFNISLRKKDEDPAQGGWGESVCGNILTIAFRAEFASRDAKIAALEQDLSLAVASRDEGIVALERLKTEVLSRIDALERNLCVSRIDALERNLHLAVANLEKDLSLAGASRDEGIVSLERLKTEVVPRIDALERGLCVSRIDALENNFRLALASRDERIVALEQLTTDIASRDDALERGRSDLLNKPMSSVEMTQTQGRNNYDSQLNFNFGSSAPLFNNVDRTSDSVAQESTAPTRTSKNGDTGNGTASTDQVTQHNRIFNEIRANAGRTRCRSPRNAGLENSGKVCYANAIFQAFASCTLYTTSFDDPPQQNHERIPLCYEFSKLLHLMVKNQTSDQDLLNPKVLIDHFLRLHSDFVDTECEYC
jgi:hypothetical protein